MATDRAQAPPAAISATTFSSLFQAVDGLRNRAALAAMIGCTVVGVLVAGLLVAIGALGFIGDLLAFLVYVIAVGTGVNAAGVLHMDAARGAPPRSLVDALVYGLTCIPKLIVLALAFIAVEIVVFIVLAIVFFICKIPFLGPLMFAVVFPVSVVVAGITVCGLFLCLVLSLPAIWEGETITRALAQTLAIARSRLVEAVLLLVFVGFLGFAVGFVVFGLLGAGLVPTLGLTTTILGFSGSMGDAGSMLGMMQGYGGGGTMVAGVIGGLVLWAVAASLVGQVYLLGLCLVYLRVTEGLDPGAAEAALRGGLDEARRRAADLGEKARNAASKRDDPAATFAASAGAASTAAPAASPGPYAPQEVDVPTHLAAPVPPPLHDAPPVYNPPPAYSPPHNFIAPAPPDSVDPDIALPFDDLPPAAPPAPPPAYAAPPAYVPPPAAQAPPPAPPPPAATTCPQCLSAITPEDLFCGVCGYRLR